MSIRQPVHPLLPFLVARMMFQYLPSQGSGVDMGINLGGADAFVSQHGLDGTQVGPSLEQGGGKGWRKVCGEMVLVMPASTA